MTTAVSARELRIKQALAQALDREPEDLGNDIELNSLVAESFALIETVISLQEELSIRLLQEDLRGVKTVGDLVSVCAERL
jgi:acyl carrier protein